MAASGRLMVANMGYPALLVGGCDGRVGGGGVILGPCLPAPWLTGMLVPSGVSGWVLLGSLGLPVLGASRLPEAALDSGLSFLLIPTWAQAPEEVVGLPVVSATVLGVELALLTQREQAFLAFLDLLTASAIILS